MSAGRKRCQSIGERVMPEMKIEKNSECVSYEPAISYILHEKGGKLKLPVSGTFELTAGCNFHCGMCYIHTDSDRVGNSGELTAKQWFEIGRQARDAGMVFLLLTGGEPLLRKDFPEIYEGLKALGLIISINTNGYFLDGETAALFEKNPPSRLNVSLYGATDETYRRVCGVPAFTRVSKNIKRMKDMGIPVRINCSITPENCHELEKTEPALKGNNVYVSADAHRAGSVRKKQLPAQSRTGGLLQGQAKRIALRQGGVLQAVQRTAQRHEKQRKRSAPNSPRAAADALPRRKKQFLAELAR